MYRVTTCTFKLFRCNFIVSKIRETWKICFCHILVYASFFYKSKKFLWLLSMNWCYFIILSQTYLKSPYSVCVSCQITFQRLFVYILLLFLSIKPDHPGKNRNKSLEKTRLSLDTLPTVSYGWLYLNISIQQEKCQIDQSCL